MTIWGFAIYKGTWTELFWDQWWVSIYPGGVENSWWMNGVIIPWEALLRSIPICKDVCMALKYKLPQTKEDLPDYDADVAAGQLIYLFEQFVLAPIPHSKKGPSLNQRIKRRIRLFRSGQLEKLHQESCTVISGNHRQPLPNDHINQQSVKSTLAQRAADNDDFKKAIDRLLKATPISPNTEENIKIWNLPFHQVSYIYQSNHFHSRRNSSMPPQSEER